MTFPLPFAGLLDRFDTILRVLRMQVAARGAGHNPLPTPLVLATFGYISRCLRRVTLLVARIQSGIPPSVRPGAVRARRKPVRALADSETPAATVASLRLPRGNAWLVAALPMHAAAAGSQLQHLLAEPEMAALIDAAPGLGRVLRPLARMLGMALPAVLQLPRTVRRRVVRKKPVVVARAANVSRRGGRGLDRSWYLPVRRAGFDTG